MPGIGDVIDAGSLRKSWGRLFIPGLSGAFPQHHFLLANLLKAAPIVAYPGDREGKGGQRIGTVLRPLPDIPMCLSCFSYRPKNCDWLTQGTPITEVLCPM